MVFCIVLYFFGIMVMVFISPPLIPIVVGVSVILAILSGALLLILLIKERTKDKEAEEDDLNKY